MADISQTIRLLDADYLHFIAAAGWCVNAGLALFFLIPRQGATSSVADRGFWFTVATAFGAVGVASAVEILVGYANLFRWPQAPDLVAHLAATAATLLTLAALPRPVGFARPAVWRWGLAITVAVVGVFIVVTPTVALSGWLAIVAGFTGAYILVWALLGRAKPRDLPRRAPVYVLLGLMLIAVALAFGGRHSVELARSWPDDGRAFQSLMRVWEGAMLSFAAWGVFFVLWWIYLDECTLPRIRTRRGLLGLRPVLLLPLIEGVVLLLGGVLFLTSSRQAETYVGGRVREEVEAVASSLNWGPAVSSDAAVPDVMARQIRISLERLLQSSPSYFGVVSWRFHDGRPEIVAAASGGVPGFPFDAERLLPVVGDREGTYITGLVRWDQGNTSYTRAIVTAPVFDENEMPAWYLSVAIDSRDLSGLIASHRFQALIIIALAVIVVAFAVVYTVRTLNEAELLLLKESAEAENAGRNAFLGMISHEIRTPLQSVLGYAELAETQGLPEAAARHVRAIRTQGAILLRIVQDILDFSALRGGGLTLNPEPVSLRELLDDVQRGLTGRAQAKGIAFSTEIAATVPEWVTVDRVRLAQVLLNLAVNAVKFTDRGGVRLVIGGQAAGEHADLEISISDTGPGISVAQMRRLFEPFRKMRDDDTFGGGGVGLGLAISRQIVELLGGTIAAESIDGEGTTFRLRLRLPLAAGPAPEGSRTQNILTTAEGMVSPSLAGLHVLLIDDNPYVRELLRDFLRKLGARVCVRPDGASGLEASVGDRFDVVLLDLRLPDIAGPELAARVRAAGRDESDPWIVAISAGVSDAEIQRTLEMGVNDFMLKPVSMAGLAETIRMSPVAERLVPSAPCFVPVAEPPADLRAAFFAELEPMFGRLEQSCQDGHAAQLGAEAHYLANGCMVIGFDAGLELCRSIEKLAEIEAFPAAREKIAELRAMFARLLPEDTIARRS